MTGVWVSVGKEDLVSMTVACLDWECTFRSILVNEVYDLLMGTKLNKATIGAPWKIIKLASSHFCESLTYILNQSLQQGVVPDILKISKVTPIDKGGEVRDPTNFRPISTLSMLTLKYLKNLYISSLSTILREAKNSFSISIWLLKRTFNCRSYNWNHKYATENHWR